MRTVEPKRLRERDVRIMVAGVWRKVATALRRLIRFAVTPLEALRALRSQDIARGFPRYTRWLRRLLLLELGALVVVGIVKPPLLVPILALIALGTAWFAWQARPSRGRSKGWPPGSMGIGPQAMSDPEFYFKGWEDYGRVFKANLFDQPVVCVVGVKEAAQLLHEHADSLAPNTLAPWNRFIPGGLARWTSGETHERYRRLLGGSLGARLMGRSRGLIRQEIDRSLSLMAAESAVSGEVAPLPFIEDLVFGSWARLFFGISRTNERFEALRSNFDLISIEKQAPGRVVYPALRELQNIVTTEFARKMELADRGQFSDTLMGEMSLRDSNTATDAVTIINLIYLMETTSLDVAGLLMWLLKHAADNPQYLDQLRGDFEDSGPLSLANRMVSESVRLEQSEYLHRYATDDIRFKGMLIPKGWLVHICIHESHRDSQIFEDPNSYNPDRFLVNHAPTDYAPFGIDDRSCVGVPLTREISRGLLAALASGYDMEIVKDGPRELSPHRHWAPNPGMRLTLNVTAQPPAPTEPADDENATDTNSPNSKPTADSAEPPTNDSTKP